MSLPLRRAKQTPFSSPPPAPLPTLSQIRARCMYVRGALSSSHLHGVLGKHHASPAFQAQVSTKPSASQDVSAAPAVLWGAGDSAFPLHLPWSHSLSRWGLHRPGHAVGWRPLTQTLGRQHPLCPVGSVLLRGPHESQHAPQLPRPPSSLHPPPRALST